MEFLQSQNSELVDDLAKDYGLNPRSIMRYIYYLSRCPLVQDEDTFIAIIGEVIQYRGSSSPDSQISHREKFRRALKLFYSDYSKNQIEAILDYMFSNENLNYEKGLRH